MSKRTRGALWVLPVMALCLFTGLMLACDGSQAPSDNKYSKYLFLKNGALVFDAPFSAVINDSLTTQKADLKVGDSMRFPQTEEIGDMLKVMEITPEYALLEYSHYSAPPASDTQQKYQFKIYP